MQQQLYNIVFNKSDGDWDNSSFLKNILEEYPYFGLAHFFNLKNTSTSKNSYDAVAAKTALFFNSPFLLQLNLNIKEEKVAITDLINEVIIENSNTNQNENLIVLQVIEVSSKNFKNISHKENISDEKNDSLLIENIEKKEFENEILHVNEETIISKATEQTITDENKTKFEKEEMLFEPLSASDYFASQGIKLSDVVFNDDKLGKQLKSFTSWLKTMKKVHPNKLPLVNTIVEAKIQSQAAKSNIEEDVITESMAEAYALQGKYIRAIEVYEKLSLQNPEKSAYFTAKIEQLKN